MLQYITQLMYSNIHFSMPLYIIYEYIYCTVRISIIIRSEVSHTCGADTGHSCFNDINMCVCVCVLVYIPTIQYIIQMTECTYEYIEKIIFFMHTIYGLPSPLSYVHVYVSWRKRRNLHASNKKRKYIFTGKRQNFCMKRAYLQHIVVYCRRTYKQSVNVLARPTLNTFTLHCRWAAIVL